VCKKLPWDIFNNSDIAMRLFLFIFTFLLILINRYLLKDRNDPNRDVNPPNSIEKPEEVYFLIFFHLLNLIITKSRFPIIFGIM
jgi:hypothetical protein